MLYAISILLSLFGQEDFSITTALVVDKYRR
jgi:hypothetical protein